MLHRRHPVRRILMHIHPACSMLGIGASKAMATQFANKIISMMDSKEKALSLIKRMTESLAESDNPGEETDAALMLDDLHVAVTRLEGRIKKTTGALTGKDPGTARSIKAAVKNEYLARRLKARAVLMRVHQKVKHSLLAAVPYRRRVSRAKKGECLQCCSLKTLPHRAAPKRRSDSEAH